MRFSTFHYCVGLLLIARSHASPTPNKRATGITWGPCDASLEAGKSLNITINCANLTVPLDYTNPDNGTLDLHLLRVPSTTGRNNGSVLFNFGGPGNTGRSDMARVMSLMVPTVGIDRDLVIFDPRGTAETLTMSCYNATERATANLIYPLFSNSSDTAVGLQWANGENLADLCYERLKDIGSYVGTAFVARDLINVAEALGEDGMLRYYGASYGTTLGATVAAMFPDKIDKMVLDGVLNSHEYYHAYETEWISGTDLSWSGFFQGCVAAPESCVLAKNGKSAEQLEGEFFDFLYKLKYEPIPNPTLGTVVGYTELKSVALVALYSPGIWPTIALVLENIYTGNLTLFNKVYAQASTPDDASATPEAIYGIKCSEKTTPAHNFADYEPYIQKTYDSSELLGDAYTSWDMICSQWKMRAKEVYEGDFNVKTKNPILFVSNTFDPLTPITSGRNMSSGFEGSVLLEQHGYGHALHAQASACTIGWVRKYFSDGSLPEAGTVCEPDIPLFSNKTFADVLAILDSTT